VRIYVGRKWEKDATRKKLGIKKNNEFAKDLSKERRLVRGSKSSLAAFMCDRGLDGRWELVKTRN